jgi:thioredoxin 1
MKILLALAGAALIAGSFALAGRPVTGRTAQTADAMMSKSYIDYSKEAFDKASAQKRVLFFAASWCPTCRSADKDFTANLKKLPENVVIFKADYDTETALKTKYNISRQHTFVYLDKAGKALKTWSGGATAEILENTK